LIDRGTSKNEENQSINQSKSKSKSKSRRFIHSSINKSNHLQRKRCGLKKLQH